MKTILSKIFGRTPEAPSATPNLPAPPESGPWKASEWPGVGVVVQSSDLTHDVAMIIDGTFENTEDKLLYAHRMAEFLNAATDFQASGVMPVAPAPVSRDPDPAVIPDAAIPSEVQDPEPVLEPEFGVGRTDPPLEPTEEDIPPLDSEAVDRIASTSIDAPLVNPQIQAESLAHQQKVKEAQISQMTEIVGSSRPIPCGCHYDLQPGQQPDSCVIDHNRRDLCVLAVTGIEKSDCPHWRPIKFVKATDYRGAGIKKVA